MAQQADNRLEDLTLGQGATLAELVDKRAWGDLVDSVYRLFRVPLRIFTREGRLLADSGPPDELYQYLGSTRGARRVLQGEVDAVKALDPGVDGSRTFESVTGAHYRVLPISYDARQLGRMVLGPFIPATLNEVPRGLLDLDEALDLTRLKQHFARMPRARPDTVDQIGEHLQRTLELILFAGHKSLLTSNMHLATVRESYRELQEKNASLQEAYDRLKELDRLKSNFLATVSHELRTPLTSIIGYSEMLGEGIVGELNAEQKDFIGTIREKGEQLLELIKSLLDLSKLESGTMSLRKRELDVAELVKDIVATLTPVARKKGVVLKPELEPGLGLLWGDPERLRQVLINLTENAIKFTGAEGVVTVAASSGFLALDDDGGPALFAEQRPAILFDVRDSGIGIPDEEKLRVFDAFYQVDSTSTREAQGTGLGLSIVKRLVDGHDGSIDILDNAPHGAIFRVTIPLRRATVG